MSDVLISGTIVQALPLQQGVSQRTGTQWMRASYIIEHEHGQYPKRMVFDVSGNKIQELNLQLGETVTLHLNISCREYPENSGKFFNSIEAWKVDRAGQQPYAPQQVYPPVNGQAPFPQQPTAAPQPAPFQPQPSPQPQGQQLPFPPAQ